MRRCTWLAAVIAFAACGSRGASPPVDAGSSAHHFRKITLSTEFTCEGASYGDFDRNGVMDVVALPYWYEGPTFTTRHQLFPPVVADPKGYSDCFFAFVRDVNADGWDDVLAVGFPGQAALWYENPKQPDAGWTSHAVFSMVDNEAPTFTDLTGDGTPELVFSNAGSLGWATPDPASSNLPWTFHPATLPEGFSTFTHGLGVGDVDGDGRADLLEATGWRRQPASLAGDPVWERRPQSFGPGGAQMSTQDVDGDGDADVITTLAAHGSGLAWYEQQPGGGFVPHVIVPQEEGGALTLHEPHALAVIDIDGDGLRDIVTGERFWGHVPAGEPDFNAPARLYWFQLVRDARGARYVPHLVDDASGVGTQVVAGDFTGDGLPDIVVANKKGAFAFIHETGASGGQ
jgi:hypothetical protein